jgi:hypothetical protein
MMVEIEGLKGSSESNQMTLKKLFHYGLLFTIGLQPISLVRTAALSNGWCYTCLRVRPTNDWCHGLDQS